MRRPTAAGTFLFAALLLLAGCGKKPKPAPEPDPDPTPVAVGPAPATKTDPPVRIGPADPDGPMPPLVAIGPPVTPMSGLPVAPPPSEPGKGPAAPEPNPLQPPPPPPALPPPPPPDGKEKEKEPATAKAAWPKDINGRTLTEYVRDATVDLDPAVRERAMRIIPNFGPEIVRKEAGWPKAVLARMEPTKERDPGVRAAAYEAAGLVGFDKDLDTKEAIRILFIAAEQGATGGGARLHAIQTLAAFGSKAETAITYLVGPAMSDVAYETRRSVAFTLGRIAHHEHAGPNPRALAALFKLTEDHSAPVRMEAYQSLVLLGPPLLPRDPKAPAIKDLKLVSDIPKLDDKQIAGYVAVIKKRLSPAVTTPKGAEGPSPTGVVERDKQVEIMARLVLMKFDPKEVTDENLGGISRYVKDKETGPKLQALNVLGLIGQPAAKRIDDMVFALADDDPTVVVAGLTAIIQLGPACKAAIPNVERLRTRGMGKDEKEYWTKLVDQATKLMRESDKAAEKKP